MDLRRTPLFTAHEALGAKLIDFGGWEMPVQYTSIIEEHTATRERAGLFDVSHMGEIVVQGKDAAACLNRLVTNDVNPMTGGQVIYSVIPNEKGGIVDDLLIYKENDESFFLVVNAGNQEKDFIWLKEKIDKVPEDSVRLEFQSEQYGQVAIQGPLAEEILQGLTEYDLSDISFFHFADITVAGKKARVSRTGYTGEDGFEVYIRTEDTETIWNKIMKAGTPKGLLPVGLGARDTLRFEAGLPLYGHEIADDISPIEAGLKFFVKLDKGDFTGKQTIEDHAVNGTTRKLVGIELIDRGVPREGYAIEKDGAGIGYIATGTHSPTFKKGLASAFIKTEFAVIDTEVEVIIREKPVKAKVVKMPFYRKKYNKL